MTKTVRILLLLILLLPLLASISCNTYDYPEDCSTYDYSTCNTTEPDIGALKISLTINDANPEVPITIYTGKIEDNNVYSRDTISVAYFEAEVPLDNYYSVTAMYKLNGKNIFALDGSELRKKSITVCDTVCWDVQGGEINVKLKY